MTREQRRRHDNPNKEAADHLANLAVQHRQSPDLSEGLDAEQSQTDHGQGD